MKDTGERLIVEGNQQTLTYGEHLSRYMSVVEIVKDKVVLDIASGTGYGAAMLAEGARKVIGVDISEEAVDYSRKHYNAKNIEYICGDAEQIPVDDNSVDVVVSFETIEHLAEPTKFMQEVKRVLKTDGCFIVSTPNDKEFTEGNEFHLHEFQLPELKEVINSNVTNSAYYFQGTYFTAALLSETTFTDKFRRDSLVATKTFAQHVEKAIYFIIVASQGDLPKLRENVILADRWSTKEDIERDKERQAHLRRLSVIQNSSDETIKRLQEENINLENRLRKILTSRCYRLVTLPKTLLRRIR